MGAFLGANLAHNMGAFLGTNLTLNMGGLFMWKFNALHGGGLFG